MVEFDKLKTLPAHLENVPADAEDVGFAERRVLGVPVQQALGSVGVRNEGDLRREGAHCEVNRTTRHQTGVRRHDGAAATMPTDGSAGEDSR